MPWQSLLPCLLCIHSVCTVAIEWTFCTPKQHFYKKKNPRVTLHHDAPSSSVITIITWKGDCNIGRSWAVMTSVTGQGGREKRIPFHTSLDRTEIDHLLLYDRRGASRRPF